MESEDVFARFDINSLLFQDKIIACIELFAASNVDFLEVKTEISQLSKTFTSDICAAYVDLFQVSELFRQSNDTFVFQCRTSQETYLSQKWASGKFEDTGVVDVSAFGKRNDFEGTRAALADVCHEAPTIIGRPSD